MSTTLEQIATWLTEHGEPNYRAKQIEQAWYAAKGWDKVTALPKDLREKLGQQFPWSSVSPKHIAVSKKDGTKKALLTLQDGLAVEAVTMPNARDKRTICISSQVGCAMGCSFCATGTMGLLRNLTTDEIVDQVRFWKFCEPGEISNIVFMGMGEPLANYVAVKAAAQTLIDKLGLGPTRITVSTVGPPAGLKKLLEDDSFPPVRIALSLHAGTDEIRYSLVPTHKNRTIASLAEWVADYLRVRGNRRHHLTLEYVMLHGKNDLPSEAEAVVRHFGRFGSQVKLNLIPWNPTGGDLAPSPKQALDVFQEICERGGVATTVRYSKGLDIAAACGQLVVRKTISV
jgi:23S rRNA (adenine2503-C2)-methyltransferase